MVKSKSQTAIEYMITYSWVIIIVVAVAAVLFGLGFFNPGSSIGSSVSGLSGFSNAQATCSGKTNTFSISLSNALSNSINVTQFNASYGSTYSIASIPTGAVMTPGAANVFTVSGVCPATSSRYSVSISIEYLQLGRMVLPGPYISTGTASGVSS